MRNDGDIKITINRTENSFEIIKREILFIQEFI